jgi:hypothetical protein
MFALVDVLRWIVGAIVVVGLLTNLRDGGWRIVLPVLVWIGAGLTLSGTLDAAARAVGFALTLASAYLLGRWLDARYDARRPNRSRTRR